MPVHITYFAASDTEDFSGNDRGSTQQGMLGTQLSAETLEVESSASDGMAATRPMVALIKVTEDCRCDVLNGSASAESGMWLAGEIDTRFLDRGERVSVIAP